MCGKNSRSRCIASWRLGSPRACGKNLHWTAARYDQTGSPPRMREEFFDQIHHTLFDRITPAHAGRIEIYVCCYGTARDHPRACGKNERTGHEWQRLPGSPPRMREEYDSCGYSSMLFGITPAHAGRIICDAVSSAFHQDHPRACGKN